MLQIGREYATVSDHIIFLFWPFVFPQLAKINLTEPKRAIMQILKESFSNRGNVIFSRDNDRGPAAKRGRVVTCIFRCWKQSHKSTNIYKVARNERFHVYCWNIAKWSVDWQFDVDYNENVEWFMCVLWCESAFALAIFYDRFVLSPQNCSKCGEDRGN